MLDKPHRTHGRSQADIRPPEISTLLTLELPDVEEIAKEIWQRQHDRLPEDTIKQDVRWRDSSIPFRFWNEFLLDAQAVLSLLYKKHIEHEKRSKGNCCDRRAYRKKAL